MHNSCDDHVDTKVGSLILHNKIWKDNGDIDLMKTETEHCCKGVMDDGGHS